MFTLPFTKAAREKKQQKVVLKAAREFIYAHEDLPAFGESNEQMYVDRIIQTDSHATIMVQEIRSESLLCIFSGNIYDFSSQISPLLWSSKKSEKFLMLIGYFLLLYTERYSFGATPYVFLNNLLKYSGLLIPTE